MINRAIIMGRLTRNPEVKNSGDLNKIVARYTLAVARNWSSNGKEETDFIPCVAFNKAAEFTSKFLKQGMLITVVGRLQTGSYINKDNQKVFSMDVIIDEQHLTPGKSTNVTSGANVSETVAVSDIPLVDELPIE